MELALSLEKLTNEKLLKLHSVMHLSFVLSLLCLTCALHFILSLRQSKCNFLIRALDFDQQVADKNNDVQLADFVENQFLSEQVLF